MKEFIIVCIIILMTGCTVVPVKQSFPDVPVNLMETPRQLTLIPKTNDVKLSEFMAVVVHNYSICHANAYQLDAWIDWYSRQRKTFEQLN